MGVRIVGTGDLDRSDSNKRASSKAHPAVGTMRSQNLSFSSDNTSMGTVFSSCTPARGNAVGAMLCQQEHFKQLASHPSSSKSIVEPQLGNRTQISIRLLHFDTFSNPVNLSGGSAPSYIDRKENTFVKTCDRKRTNDCNGLLWRLAKLRYFTTFLLLTCYNGIPVAQSARFPTSLPNVVPSTGDHVLHSEHCSHVYPKPHESPILPVEGGDCSQNAQDWLDDADLVIPEIVHGAFIEPHHVMKKRSIDQPLRIVLYYDESVHNLDQEKKDLINNNVLPEAISYWERALMVRRTERAIVLNRRCPNQQVYYEADDPHPFCKVECEAKTMCGEVQVPEEHLDVCRVCNEKGTNCRVAPNSTAGPGIAEADFVFYVSALQTHRCKHGFTVAYAAHCQQESALDRPIAGHANLCPKSISTKPQELDTMYHNL